MPITYQIDPQQRLIRTTCAGNLAVQDVLDHFRTLSQDPLYREGFDVFLDLSAMESQPDSHQLSVVIGEMKKLGRGLQFGACAILATQDALFGMMRMFEAHAEQFFRGTQTFRVASEAEQWLVARRLSSGTGPEK